MSLEAGQDLGGYRIVSLLGVGGMGEVYRATDPRLGREVAIKVLPSDLAADPERLARFEREARLLASLNHPHVASIYGFEEADRQRFLVLELVEGEDLAERLKRGPIPVDEALEIAKQIAEALEEAHDKGVVHRDLKPANVKLTPDGKVKVLDFGLAKAWDGEPDKSGSGAVDLSRSPTLAHTGTQAGIILGTAAYMSPEQARGQAVDKRADIWAFGVVLLEMLTGENPFGGPTVSDTLAGVLKTAPDLLRLPPDAPPSVRHVLERCLRKDRRQRARDIGDVRLDLAESAPAPATSGPGGGSRRAKLAVVAAALAVGAVVGAVGHRFLAAGAAGRVARLEISAPPGTRVERGLALSPDGSTLAFGATGTQGDTAIWLRRLDSLEARMLPGSAGGRLPFWSPDGRTVGFFAGGHLNIQDLVGGPPRNVAVTGVDADARGATWSPDGTIVFAPAYVGGLSRVAASGGDVAPATSLEQTPGLGTHRFPCFLPDGRHFLFYASSGSGTEPGELRLGELGSLETRRLTDASSAAVVVPGGYLVYARGSDLVAQRFDTGRLEFSGEPVPLGIEIPTGVAISGLRSLAAADDGTLVYRPEAGNAMQLVWVDRDGKQLGRIGEDRFWQIAPSLTRDGRSVVVGRIAAGSSVAGDLWRIDAARGVGTPLTFDAGDDSWAVWSPDGRRVAVARALSDQQDRVRAAVMQVDGSAPLQTLGDSTAYYVAPLTWSPDGRTLLCVSRATPTSDKDLVRIDLDSPGETTPWLATPFDEDGAQFSPDGRWVAYTSTSSGSPEVFVRPADGSGPAWQVSAGRGTFPVWSRSGDELFYRAGDGRMMAASVTVSDGALSTASPIALFDSGVADADWRDYDVAPDGRFLLNRPVSVVDAPIVVVLGFDRTLVEARR